MTPALFPSTAARPVAFAVFSFVLVLTLSACTPMVVADATPISGAGVAVVELFTSEGCSSCPPADAVLGKIAAEAKEKKLRVYPIAFHVDYWDRLGWKDHFSMTTATRRQRSYAQAMKLDSVYTPQAVVNGTSEFNGSDENRVRQEIAAAVHLPATASVVLRDAKRERGSVRVHLTVDGVDAASTLHVVAVSGDVTTDVRRGENGGRKLRHTSVALAIDSRAISGHTESDVTLTIADGEEPAAVIAFVQRDDDHHVAGAGKIDIEKAPVPPAGLGVTNY